MCIQTRLNVYCLTREREIKKERDSVPKVYHYAMLKSCNDKTYKIYIRKYTLFSLYMKNARVINSVDNSPSFVNGSKLSKVAQKYIIL